MTPLITQLATAQAMGVATPAQLGQLAALQAQAQGLGGALATTQAGDGVAQDMTWDDS